MLLPPGNDVLLDHFSSGKLCYGVQLLRCTMMTIVYDLSSQSTEWTQEHFMDGRDMTVRLGLFPVRTVSLERVR